MFEPKERWPLVYSRIPEYTKESQPHTAKLETPVVIQGYIDRINARRWRYAVPGYRGGLYPGAPRQSRTGICLLAWRGGYGGGLGCSRSPAAGALLGSLRGR